MILPLDSMPSFIPFRDATRSIVLMQKSFTEELQVTHVMRIFELVLPMFFELSIFA
ncbi:hypothetical protein PADK2_20640 [Pseudomonas aeruginosa DK2]|nr:hypothetical protein PADK2_20640 [Pseudomonas aeruginosa DK2]KFB21713.1 hypothetical protein PGPR2_22800 [Pseudomonas aeruginosa PGPR2]